MNKKGKLIVIESGSDGSGKQTQTRLLYNYLLSKKEKVRSVTFPNYSHPSSTLVKSYLSGEFGNNPQDVGYYPASVFYSMDRYVSFNTDWKDFYNEGGIIISDRYTTSNMIYQGAKIQDMQEKKSYLHWLEDFEYVKLGLPRPDLVIYLNVPTSICEELRKGRELKFDIDVEDIHESDRDYLNETYDNSLFISEYMKFEKIECIDNNGNLLSIDDIHKKVIKATDKLL